MWSCVGVSGGYAVFAEGGEDGGGVDIDVVADAGEGPAELVEVDCFVDLFGGQAAAAHGHIMAVQDEADRLARNLEPGTELVDRQPILVAGDEFLNLLSIKSARSPGLGPVC